MYLKKLKPTSGLGGLWFPIVTFMLFFLFSTFISAKIGFALVILVFLVLAQFSFYAYYRTRNITYIFSGIFQVLFTGFLLFAPHVGFVGENKFVALICLFFSFGFVLAAISQVIAGNHRWKGRDIFEMAAMNINETSNGFTSRPHPYGQFDFTRNEILHVHRHFKISIELFIHRHSFGSWFWCGRCRNWKLIWNHRRVFYRNKTFKKKSTFYNFEL